MSQIVSVSTREIAMLEFIQTYLENTSSNKLLLSELKQFIEKLNNAPLEFEFISNVSNNKSHNERGAGRKRIPATKQVIECRNSGMTVKDIASELGISVATVNRILHPKLRK